MFCMILSSFPLIFCLFCSVSDGKGCFSIRKSISTSKRCVEHPFAGWNTQHTRAFLPNNFTIQIYALQIIGWTIGVVNKGRRFTLKYFNILNKLIKIADFFGALKSSLDAGMWRHYDILTGPWKISPSPPLFFNFHSIQFKVFI